MTQKSYSVILFINGQKIKAVQISKSRRGNNVLYLPDHALLAVIFELDGKRFLKKPFGKSSEILLAEGIKVRGRAFNALFSIEHKELIVHEITTAGNLSLQSAPSLRFRNPAI